MKRKIMKIDSKEYEDIMKQWDEIRRLLLEQRDESSLPRDMFETILDNLIGNDLE